MQVNGYGRGTDSSKWIWEIYTGRSERHLMFIIMNGGLQVQGDGLHGEGIICS